MRKTMITFLAATAMSMAVCMSAFASGWQGSLETGLWFGANEDNSKRYANGWMGVIDREKGGAAFYYFNEQGYVLTNTTTPDGNQVNELGQWVKDGVVQYSWNSLPAGLSRRAVAVDGAVETSAKGWQQEADGGWKYAYNGTWLSGAWTWITTKTGKMECYCFNSGGYILTNTTTPNGRTLNADGKWEVDGVVQTITQPIPVEVMTEAELEATLTQQGKTLAGELGSSAGSSGSSIFEREGYDEAAVDEYVESYKDLVDSIKNLERDVKSGQQMLEDHKRRMYSGS